MTDIHIEDCGDGTKTIRVTSTPCLVEAKAGDTIQIGHYHFVVSTDGAYSVDTEFVSGERLPVVHLSSMKGDRPC